MLEKNDRPGVRLLLSWAPGNGPILKASAEIDKGCAVAWETYAVSFSKMRGVLYSLYKGDLCDPGYIFQNDEEEVR